MCMHADAHLMIFPIIFYVFILAQAIMRARCGKFAPYAICAMAVRSKFEIARVDHTWYHPMASVDETSLPDAKWWHPFSKDGGDMAFREKPVLFTSAFNPNGSGTLKYDFWRSMNANGQEVKVYSHCGCLHSIFVRQAASLRVYLSTSQLTEVGETDHMITLKKVVFPNDVIIFEKEFSNDGSDITLGQILPLAKCHLIENNHVTDAGKLEVIFEGMVVTTKLKTVLVKRFGRKEPSKRQKTSSGSGGAAPEAPPEAAEAPPERAETPEPEQSSSMWPCALRDHDGVCNHDPLPCVHSRIDTRGPEQRGSP
jgi:hypothetical protein